jgi:hypothetical protein
MAVCNECGREYLDSYQSCPFCARARVSAQAPPLPEPKKPGALSWLWPWLGGATALGIAIVAVVYFVSIFVAVPAGVRAGQSQQCFAIAVALERAVMSYQAVEERAPDSLGQVSDWGKVGERRCPAGGTYTLDASSDPVRVTCSVHGWHGDPR